MEIKNIKKGATIRDVMLVVIMFVGGIALFLNFISLNAVESGVGVDAKFNDTYNNLASQQTQVSELVTDLSSAARNLTEAQVGDFAFFGLRGILKLMQLPLVLLNVAQNSFSYVSVLFDPVPNEAKVMILISILIIIIFAIIKFITSRATEA